jgi:hypothetical protein
MSTATEPRRKNVADKEIKTVATVVEQLESLEPDARRRTLVYLQSRFAPVWPVPNGVSHIAREDAG